MGIYKGTQDIISISDMKTDIEKLKEAIEPFSWKERVNANEKKLKGYMFDGLVFRFKDYQSKAFGSEVREYEYKHCTGRKEAKRAIRDIHNRDLMKFIEILNEAIGEHD